MDLAEAIERIEFLEQFRDQLQEKNSELLKRARSAEIELKNLKLQLTKEEYKSEKLKADAERVSELREAIRSAVTARENVFSMVEAALQAARQDDAEAIKRARVLGWSKG